LPPELASDLTAYIGCLAGAVGVEDYRSGLGEAGFSQMEIIDSGSDLNVYAKVELQGESCCSAPSAPGAKQATSCCSPSPVAAREAVYYKQMSELCAQYDFNEYAASVKIFAVKS
jgi:arsenite methyltransferase